MKTWEDIRQEITVFTDEEKDEMDFVEGLISTIINRRNQMNLSQRDLAKITGIKQPAIARIESLRITPKITTLFQLCKALNLNIELTESRMS